MLNLCGTRVSGSWYSQLLRASPLIPLVLCGILFTMPQDLKDYMRQAGEVTFADAHKQRRNEGIVEFASYKDLRNVIDKLDGTELNGRKIKLVEDRATASKRSRTVSTSRSRSHSRSRSRSNKRSKSRSRSEEKDSSKSPSAKDKNDSRDKSRSNSRASSKSRSRSRSPANEEDN